MRWVWMFVALATLGGCKKDPAADPNAVDVICYPAASNGWIFDCVVTGKGEEKADEQFSSNYVSTVISQGNDATRSFRGTRWRAHVVVERVGTWGGVKAEGGYTLYGTVDRIEGRRVRLTDCVFAAPPKN